MVIKIGNTIKTLRSGRHITQEQLATCLGVTPQAISRWEAENGYPDIEMLPRLADFFSVTVDELIGYNQTEREQKKRDVRKEIKRLRDIGAGEDMLRYARQSVALYPSEPAFQLNLANCLSGECWNDPPDRASLLEAEILYQTVAETCAEDADKYNALGNLCTLYAKGFHDGKKAEEAANRLPEMIYCREFAKSVSLEGEQAVTCMQDEIEKLADYLGMAIQNLAINGAVPNDPPSWDQKIGMLETSRKLYELIYGENLMFFHSRLAFNYQIVSALHMARGEAEEAIDSLEGMCRHTLAYGESRRNDGGKRYASPLVSRLTSPPAWLDVTEEYPLCRVMLERLEEDKYNPIRDDVRFGIIMKALQAPA